MAGILKPKNEQLSDKEALPLTLIVAEGRSVYGRWDCLFNEQLDSISWGAAFGFDCFWSDHYITFIVQERCRVWSIGTDTGYGLAQLSLYVLNQTTKNFDLYQENVNNNHDGQWHILFDDLLPGTYKLFGTTDKNRGRLFEAHEFYCEKICLVCANKKINPLSVYLNTCKMNFTIQNEDTSINFITYKIIDDNDRIIVSDRVVTLNENITVEIPYIEVPENGILVIKSNDKVIDKIYLRKEQIDRTNCLRTFTNIETGYIRKNLLQRNRISIMI